MMGKILGNATLLFLAGISFCVSAQGLLHVVDEMGNPLKKVQAGRPFMIELKLSGGGALDDAPVVEGLDQFALQDSSWSHSIINGDVTISYRYNVIVTEPGTYAVGPAFFSRNNTQEVSNAVQIEVGIQSEAAEQEGDGGVIVRLALDKDHAVVGERVVATLRYYYTDPSQRLRNFVEQQAEDITRKKARGPRAGQEIIDGAEYDYIELDWDMYPQKAGSLTVPAFAAEYEVKMPRNPMFGGISRLLGMAATQKRAYSNAVTLQVNEVPACDPSPQGVGIIDSFELMAHPSVVSQGEGAVITLALKGDFNPDQITIPGLQNVPKELRYYESKESAEEPSSASSPAVKQFEYIVQGLHPGSWEIPAQTFHYYDVATQSHRALSTAPLSMTIMPGTPRQKPSVPDKTVSGNRQKALPIIKTELRPTGKPFILPWWLFFLLVTIPFFAWVFRRGRYSLYVRREKTYRARRSYQAFSIAQAHLAQLKNKKSGERLYALFIELFADKWQVPIGSITAEYIAQRLKDIGMSQEQWEQWNDFFAAIAQQAFGAQQSEQQINDLFRQAEQWLERLKQLL